MLLALKVPGSNTACMCAFLTPSVYLKANGCLALFGTREGENDEEEEWGLFLSHTAVGRSWQSSTNPPTTVPPTTVPPTAVPPTTVPPTTISPH